MSALPTLYSRNRRGNTQQWTVKTALGKIMVEYGLKGGKMRIQTTSCKPKNIGRSNETTSEQQAEKEALAKWRYQIKAVDYNEDIDKANLQLFPMLANDYLKVPHRVDWKQAMAQPKLDGLRLLIGWRYESDIGNYDCIEMISREGDGYVVDHLIEPARKILQKINEFRASKGLSPCRAIDGEAYIHGVSLQKITSYCNKYHRGYTEHVEFHVFDLVIIDDPFIVRDGMVKHFFTHFDASFKTVESQFCRSEKEMFDLHGRFTQEGFEGLIIRHSESLYEIAFRSGGLFKYKHFMDMECLIISIWEDKNGLAMFEMKTPDNLVFDCTPKKSHKERKSMLEPSVMFELIDSWWSIKYQGLYEDGLPQFPRAINPRKCGPDGQPSQ